jgi:hypothetical protein
LPFFGIGLAAARSNDRLLHYLAFDAMRSIRHNGLFRGLRRVDREGPVWFFVRNCMIFAPRLGSYKNMVVVVVQISGA